MWTLSWTGNIPLAFTAPCTAWNQTRWFTYKGRELTSLGKNRFSLYWAVPLARNHFWQCSCNNGWNYLQKNFKPLFSVVPLSVFSGAGSQVVVFLPVTCRSSPIFFWTAIGASIFVQPYQGSLLSSPSWKVGRWDTQWWQRAPINCLVRPSGCLSAHCRDKKRVSAC